jgi:hypothetical protein
VSIDHDNAKGYVGDVRDPTPNENYTVSGVIAGLPTPESDLEYAAELKAAFDAASRNEAP